MKFELFRLLLAEEGIDTTDARMLPLAVPTVMSAHRAYREGGWAAVNVKPRGRKRGEGRQLTPVQKAQIDRLVCNKTPDQLKLGFALPRQRIPYARQRLRRWRAYENLYF